MGANDTQYEFWRKSRAVVLAYDSGIVITDKAVELALVLDKLVSAIARTKRPSHFPQECSYSRKLGGPGLSGGLS